MKITAEEMLDKLGTEKTFYCINDNDGKEVPVYYRVGPYNFARKEEALFARDLNHKNTLRYFVSTQYIWSDPIHEMKWLCFVNVDETIKNDYKVVYDYVNAEALPDAMADTWE